MSEEKVRVSGEKERLEPEPVLPTVNPAVTAAQDQKKASIPAAVYIA